MATSSGVASNEEFYKIVRKRTAESFRKKYVTSISKKDEELIEQLRSKPGSAYSLGNVIWLLSSIAIFYLTDFALVLIYDPRIYRLWFNIGVASLSVAVLCCLYCIVWLSWIKGVRSEKWEDHNAFVIPIATAAGIVAGGFICYSVWPVWSIFTIPIVASQFMGFIVIVAMIPSIF
ncbi:transmembrane protein 128-like [Watersipora subatra]|uniref:transmembrane protein 128-like n=1 Tax=Watersipora subatra TaxID=2589382 RepID=UPI00355C7577